MRITIIGWYGTETIGDRAILSGILFFFNEVYRSVNVKLGSLYPFYSHRMLSDDFEIWTSRSDHDFNIELFDSQELKQLNDAITWCDLLVMGGGPLMHVSPLFMVEYAFKKAQKHKKITAILGCGIGPLFKKKFKRAVATIVDNSDILIFRDTMSIENLTQTFKELHLPFHKEKAIDSLCPSIKCAIEYSKDSKPTEDSYIAINLRSFPIEYTTKKRLSINETLKCFIENISYKYSNTEIKLIPMHYFHIGNDDRFFLNEIAYDLKLKNLVVQNTPLSLFETMAIFENAQFSIGMRFHSVLLQTILNGKNFILDYTEPQRGKISGFIKDIDKNNFYLKRYTNLQENVPSADIIQHTNKKFIYPVDFIDKKLQVYCQKLTEFDR